jgi:hypothetical protein
MTRIHSCGKVLNTYFAATPITHVIPAPKITLCVFRLIRMTRIFEPRSLLRAKALRRWRNGEKAPAAKRLLKQACAYPTESARGLRSIARWCTATVRSFVPAAAGLTMTCFVTRTKNHARAFQTPRNDGHVLECGGVPPLLGKPRVSFRPRLRRDLRAAEHRRTPKRKRN